MRLLAIFIALAAVALPAAESGPAGSGSDTAADRAAFTASLSTAYALRSAGERVAAARQGVAAAGALADPRLDLGYSRKRSADGNQPLYDVGLEQPLPRWGERDAQRSRAHAGVTVAEADFRVQVGDLAAEVAGQLAELAAAQELVQVVADSRARAAAAQEAILRRVASAGAGLAEQLAVQTRIAQLDLEAQEAAAAAADAEASVRGLLALPAPAPLPPFAAPDPAAIDSERVPTALLARAQAQEADAALQMARSRRYPETAIGLAYEREQTAAGDEDTIGLRLSIGLPVHPDVAGSAELAALAGQREAQAAARGAAARAQALVERARRAVATASAAQALAQGTGERLAAQYAAQVDAAASAADGTASGSIVMLLDILDRVGDTRRQALRAVAAGRSARAALWRLAPPDLSTPTQARP